MFGFQCVTVHETDTTLVIVSSPMESDCTYPICRYLLCIAFFGLALQISTCCCIHSREDDGQNCQRLGNSLFMKAMTMAERRVNFLCRGSRSQYMCERHCQLDGLDRIDNFRVLLLLHGECVFDTDGGDVVSTGGDHAIVVVFSVVGVHRYPRNLTSYLYLAERYLRIFKCALVRCGESLPRPLPSSSCAVY